MRYGWWSEKELRLGDLPKLLREVERTWGVHVHVSVCQMDGFGDYCPMLIAIEVPSELHRSELCDPPQVVVPMIDRRLMALEAQMCCTLAQWVDMVSEHMKAQSSPP